MFKGVDIYKSYKENLLEAIQNKRSNLCLGVDLHLEWIPGFLKERSSSSSVLDSARKLCYTLVDASIEKIPVIKFQMAMFEALGADGFSLLQELILYSKEKKIITILDAKRGDISSTMKAYGDMAFSYMNADAITISPYMGLDVLTPLSSWMKNVNVS